MVTELVEFVAALDPVTVGLGNSEAQIVGVFRLMGSGFGFWGVSEPVDVFLTLLVIKSGDTA